MTIAALPLLETLRDHAEDPDLFHALDHHPAERSWRRLLARDDLELWLITWPSGSETGWHDHGSAAGAFTVLRGSLVEHAWDGSLRLRDLGPGDTRSFAASHIHDVRNTSQEPAVSLHAYSPRLETMTRYRFLGNRVEALGVERAGEEW
jgi:quercetin dioxygenase-like cupin family protein